jgi:hypothetical protein
MSDQYVRFFASLAMMGRMALWPRDRLEKIDIRITFADVESLDEALDIVDVVNAKFQRGRGVPTLLHNAATIAEPQLYIHLKRGVEFTDADIARMEAHFAFQELRKSGMTWDEIRNAVSERADEVRKQEHPMGVEPQDGSIESGS